MSGAGIPILTYHSIRPGRDVTATDPCWFAETMDALATAGWRTIDLHDWIGLGRPDLARRFALTFDDGLRSIVAAADVLARYRFTATVFLVTDRMGSDNAWAGQPRGIAHERLLSWSELDALTRSGFTWAAHGRTHTRLDRCDAARLDDELRGSRRAIEDRTGRSCRLFAFPYGKAGPEVAAAAARSFDAAFGTRLDYADSAQDLFELSRIDAYYLRSPRTLQLLLEQRWRGRLPLRRALRAARNWGREPSAILRAC